jgi:hypothetical protein
MMMIGWVSEREREENVCGGEMLRKVSNAERAISWCRDVVASSCGVEIKSLRSLAHSRNVC